MAGTRSKTTGELLSLLGGDGKSSFESFGRGMVWIGHGVGFCSLLRVLVYGFPSRAKGHGRGFHERRPPNSADRGYTQNAFPVPRDSSRADRGCIAGKSGPCGL